MAKLGGAHRSLQRRPGPVCHIASYGAVAMRNLRATCRSFIAAGIKFVDGLSTGRHHDPPPSNAPSSSHQHCKCPSIAVECLLAPWGLCAFWGEGTLCVDQRARTNHVEPNRHHARPSSLHATSSPPVDLPCSARGIPIPRLPLHSLPN